MRVITATFLLVLPSLPVHAQQQNTITLACNGTSKLTATAAADFKPDPITNLGIIVNVADRTVTFTDYVTPVTGVNATLVSFQGRQQPTFGGQPFGKPFSIFGSIDRVTGHTEIDWMYEVVGNNSHWELTCRPATRLFSDAWWLAPKPSAARSRSGCERKPDNVSPCFDTRLLDQFNDNFDLRNSSDRYLGSDRDGPA